MAELGDDTVAARVDVSEEDGTPVLMLSGDLDLPGAQRIRPAVDAAADRVTGWRA